MPFFRWLKPRERLPLLKTYREENGSSVCLSGKINRHDAKQWLGYMRLHVWGRDGKLCSLSQSKKQRSETVLNRFRQPVKPNTWTYKNKREETVATYVNI